MTQFTFEEINLIFCYKESTRVGTVAGMTNALPYMEQDLQALAGRAIEKLNTLTAEEFTKLIFEPVEDIA